MEMSSMIPPLAQRPDTGLSGMPLSDEETLKRHKEVFSSICCRLANTIQKQKPIQDRELFDFSEIVIWSIRDSITSLPDMLDGLSGQISDYWHFEADSDKNSKRKNSYIRLYQMVVQLQIFAHEQEQKQRILAAVRENMQNEETISLLHNFPGITYRRLREIRGLSSEELKIQLNSLQKERFLNSRGSGENQYYMLSNDGEALYGHLHTQEKKMRFVRKRRELFDAILQILLQGEMRSHQIILIFEYLQNCGNEELTQLLWILKQKISTVKTEYNEETPQFIVNSTIRDIRLPKHETAYFQTYQIKAIKEELPAPKEYQNFEIYMSKATNRRMREGCISSYLKNDKCTY